MPIPSNTINTPFQFVTNNSKPPITGEITGAIPFIALIIAMYFVFAQRGFVILYIISGSKSNVGKEDFVMKILNYVQPCARTPAIPMV